jgi:uncharacterized damage-inducible protein DinB
MINQPVFTANDAMRWHETAASGWRKLLHSQPGILALPCSIANTKNVAQLLQHIVAVELRYAERIAGKPETNYDSIPCDSVEAIYATHDRASALFNEALAAGIDWEQTIDFVTRSAGAAHASLKTIFFHAIFHSIRHYAQLATLIREHGYAIDCRADYLFMGARFTRAID